MPKALQALTGEDVICARVASQSWGLHTPICAASLLETQKKPLRIRNPERVGQGRSLSRTRSSSEAPSGPPTPGCLASSPPLGAHHSAVSGRPSPTHRPGNVQEPGTYQDKEQKSWGKEAKSHLHCGVGPFSFAPLKFQIPVCGQSPNFLTI